MALKIASVFSDNCVLQRNKEIAVFGWGNAGEEVSVALFYNEDGNERKLSASTVCNGNVPLRDAAGSTDGSLVSWLVYLPALKENKGCRLVIESGSEKIELGNIAIGEVWLAGGQSNMEFELQNCTTGAEHLKNDDPDVRFYYTQKKGWIDEDFLSSEASMGWSEFNENSAKCWSAVGYIFAKHLSEAIGVTVGLIGCNWGGTSASTWMSREALAEDPDTASYMIDYEKNIGDKSEEEQIREYQEYIDYSEDWARRYSELWEKDHTIEWNAAQEILGPNRWPGPLNCRNPFRPGGLYECMLKRVAPYSLKGFLFYQGESDDHKPGTYYKLFGRMIKEWRDAWGGESLPFLFVQLPGHRYEADPDYKHWCVVREAQQRISEDACNTGMAVIIDAGEFNDIHPKDKEPVGERLFLQAMERVYGGKSADEAESPEPDSIIFKDGSAVVRFKYAGDGLVIRAHGTDKQIHGFELAGEDKEFVPAKAVLSIDGREVFVSAPEIKEPAYIRYLWTNYPERVSLYSRFGIPARPFRTDHDGGEPMTHETTIRQVMEL